MRRSSFLGFIVLGLRQFNDLSIDLRTGELQQSALQADALFRLAFLGDGVDFRDGITNAESDQNFVVEGLALVINQVGLRTSIACLA